MFMVADKTWKMIHFVSGHRPMLFNLKDDPGEVSDLGGTNMHADVIDMMYDRLFDWTARPAARTTITNDKLRAARTAGAARKGVLLGVVTEDDLPEELTAKYRNRKVPDMRTKEKSRV